MGKTEKPKSSWRERRKDIKYKGLSPFIYAEWLCERLSYRLGHLGRLAIIIAVIFYFMEAKGRRKVRHYQAWQVINTAQGKPGSGGRRDALQDLNRDGVSLVGIDISNAYLPYIDLKHANLSGANLSGAYLRGAKLRWTHLRDANLSGAKLSSAYLSCARLYYANLSGAELGGANLSGAVLSEANLSGAHLNDANFSGADLMDTNLTNAYLVKANLSGANLSGANLDYANLEYANLSGANLMNIQDWRLVKSIECANIYGVKNAPNGFIEWAKEQGAVEIEDWTQWHALLEEKRRKNK